MDSIKEHLQNLYPDCWEELEQRIEALTESWKLKMGSTSGEALYPWVSKDDVMLITYGDGIKREGGSASRDTPLILKRGALRYGERGPFTSHVPLYVGRRILSDGF